MPKVSVNAEICGSCGLCVGAAPEIFEFDDEGHAQAIVDEISEELDFECPFGAIVVE